MATNGDHGPLARATAAKLAATERIVDLIDRELAEANRKLDALRLDMIQVKTALNDLPVIRAMMSELLTRLTTSSPTMDEPFVEELPES